ncbi:MAG TPA: MotA/TolQ/ExbB proton channel family protein [Eggerthellaceae bacterium]|nr:MotA/TolQ/ExbB proton channel family protein [Eggerthellaceae bacterium]
MLVNMMHTIASALQGPVIALLMALAVLVVVLLGMLVAEFFTERRYFRLSIPDLVDDLQHCSDPEQVVRESGMLRRQKNALYELLNHPDATSSERESMAVNIVAQEQAIFDNRVKVTDFISKVGPMLGLMGTLIPLGPGVIAIGVGDTQTLSDSLLVAFDTTIMGLIVAGISLLISAIRKAWYAKYNAAFAAACEIVLEKANEGAVLGVPLDEQRRAQSHWGADTTALQGAAGGSNA